MRKLAGRAAAKKNLVTRRLAALGDEAESQVPRLPVAVALREAEDLHQEAQAERKRFAALPGFDLDDIDELPALINELRRAQAAWVLADKARKKVSRTALRREALKLRGDLVAAARYLLRDNQAAQRELKSMNGSRGRRPPLHRELYVLARFIERHRAALAVAPVVAAGGAKRAQDLSEALQPRRSSLGEAGDALEARDRVRLAIEAAIRAVQHAARYLFRGHKDKLRGFQSRYLNSKLKRSRANRKRLKSNSQ